MKANPNVKKSDKDIGNKKKENNDKNLSDWINFNDSDLILKKKIDKFLKNYL